MEYPSKLIETAVEEISKLPGIGRKTALRLAMSLLKEDIESVKSLSEAIIKLRAETVYCGTCHNISDEPVCEICNNHRRDKHTICVVEDARDVMAIENTSQYRGQYHVIGGIISPIMGVGPSDLNLDTLVNRVAQKENGVEEIILALSPTMEGDTTAYYITKRLKEFPVRISSIARGIPIGGELEYTDEITLGRSILTRTTYEHQA